MSEIWPSGELTSEPKLRKSGPRVATSVTSLKALNEDVNTFNVYAYAYDELDKLSAIYVGHRKPITWGT